MPGQNIVSDVRTRNSTFIWMNNKIYGLAMFALVANPSECKGRINKTLDAFDLA